MKILITGSSGQLAKELKRIVGNYQYDFVFVGRKEVNLLDQNSTLNLIKSIQPSHIIHTAAKVGGINFNISQNYQMLDYNLSLDLNVINAAQRFHVNNFIYYSSSCVYPLSALQPFETQYLGYGDFEPSNEFYAIAKSTITKLLQGIDADSNKNFKTLVLSNLYGVNDNFNDNESHVLASAFKKIFVGKKVEIDFVDIWGDGTSRREFTLAADVAKFTLESLPIIHTFPSILNLGTGVDYSITEIYETIGKVLGYKGSFRYSLNLPNGVRTKLMNSEVANNKFGWNPEKDLLKGIRRELGDKVFDSIDSRDL